MHFLHNSGAQIRSKLFLRTFGGYERHSVHQTRSFTDISKIGNRLIDILTPKNGIIYYVFLNQDGWNSSRIFIEAFTSLLIIFETNFCGDECFQNCASFFMGNFCENHHPMQN